MRSIRTNWRLRSRPTRRVNAGFAVLGALEECAGSFDTNVFGHLNVTRAALPVLRSQKSGHIFNFSSRAGFYGDPGASSYCGTKFAVEGLSESLAKAVALGTKVTVIELGYLRTSSWPVILRSMPPRSSTPMMPLPARRGGNQGRRWQAD